MKDSTFIKIAIVILLLAGIYDYYNNSEKTEIKEQKNHEVIDFTKNSPENTVENFSEEITTQEKNKKVEQPNQIIKKNLGEGNIINIPVNQPSELSYKSRKEVFDIRKKHVKNSIFNIPNYEPSEEVFGGIEDNKPWVSMRLCKYDKTRTAHIEGPSEEGRYINNPELLVGIEYSYYGYSCEELDAGRKDRKEMPYVITYDKEKNEITVVYYRMRFCNPQNGGNFNFKGLNARDLGYKYAYIDKEKSTFNFHFIEDVNASNSIVEFEDFIHVGGSCGHESGCNNGSPNQPPLNFIYPCVDGEKKLVKNKTIYIKLWKEKPSSPQQKADITEKIIIEKSWVPK